MITNPKSKGKWEMSWRIDLAKIITENLFMLYQLPIFIYLDTTTEISCHYMKYIPRRMGSWSQIDRVIIASYLSGIKSSWGAKNDLLVWQWDWHKDIPRSNFASVRCEKQDTERLPGPACICKRTSHFLTTVGHCIDNRDN